MYMYYITYFYLLFHVFFFQRYLSFIFNISLFYTNISARIIIIIIIIKHAIEIEATPDRLSSLLLGSIEPNYRESITCQTMCIAVRERGNS